MKPLSSRVSVALVLLFAFCICAPLILQAWQTRSAVPNQVLLGGLNSPPVVYKSEKLDRDPKSQIELRLDVQRLYALSTELKDEVDRANTDAVLSASVLKRAHDIEKLAKQIRERAKH
jgi:hypothetical protein